MADWYVDPQDGNDFDGASFTDGAYDHTGGANGEKSLTKIGAFAAAAANDIIYLEDNGSSDIIDGHYTIGSQVNDDVVLLTSDPTGAGIDASDVKCTQATGAAHATAYKSTRKFMDSVTVVAGDVIKICNNGTDVNIDTWSWLNMTTSIDNPVRFEAYDAPGGGTHFKTRPDGTTIPIFKIDGDGNASVTGTSVDNYVAFKGGVFFNTTSYLVYYNNGWIFEDCDFSDGSGTHLVTGGGNFQQFINCRFHTGGAGCAALRLAAGSLVEDCEFDTFVDNGIEVSSNYAFVTRCVFKNIRDDAVHNTNKDCCHVTHCTFDNNGDADARAIYLGTTNAELCAVRHNLITNYSGTGAAGIVVASGNAPSVLGPNAFYNNTTDVSNSGGVYIDNSADDVACTSDPYTNRAAEDYSLDTASEAFGSAVCPTNFDADFSRSFGAVQQVQAAGGGGSGTVIRGC